jgi:hypothetical protein
MHRPNGVKHCEHDAARSSRRGHNSRAVDMMREQAVGGYSHQRPGTDTRRVEISA